MEELTPEERAAFLPEWSLDEAEWSLDEAEWPDDKILHAMALGLF